jgi:hypothetical protein
VLASGRFISALLLLGFDAGRGLSQSHVSSPSAATVRADLGDLFQVFLGRSLTAAELDQVAREFMTVFEGRLGETLDFNMRAIGIVKTKGNTPVGLLMRHFFVTRTYFSPKQRGRASASWPSRTRSAWWIRKLSI